MMFKKNLGKRLFLCIILTVLSFSVNAQPVYQLGDIEPAGEIIFLGAMNKNVFGTSLDIGNSRGNTQLTELNINGFPNWFLPSTDELYSTYANLGQNNFGRFGNNLYWYSSNPSYNHFVWAQRFSDGYRQILNNYTAVRAF